MKLGDLILVALLIVQIVLFNLHSEAEFSSVKLAKPEIVLRDVISIEMKKGTDRVTLRKEGNDWVLPAYGSYPVTKRLVEGLMARLSGYFEGAIVGSGADAANTYQVGENKNFLRLTLKTRGGTVKTVFLAPAPGTTDYVRVGGDPNVYRLEPALSRQLEVSPRAWIDPALYRLNVHDQGEFPSKFSWEKGGREYRVGYDGRDFRFANEILDEKKVTDFIVKMRELPIDEPIGAIDPLDSDLPPITLFFDAPQKPIRLSVWHMTHEITGAPGFRVRVNEDPREVFVLAHRFNNLFDPQGYLQFYTNERLAEVFKKMREQREKNR